MSVRMIPFSSDKKAGICDALFSVQEAEKAVAFHRSLHGYEATPLRHLKNLSKVLNISDYMSRMKAGALVSMLSKAWEGVMPWLK